MERTRSNLLTFFIAMFSNTETIGKENKDFDKLTNKDYINAGITDEERAELNKSSKAISEILKGLINKKSNKNENLETIKTRTKTVLSKKKELEKINTDQEYDDIDVTDENKSKIREE